MKIIFDSEEQKENFLKLMSESDVVDFCPGNMNLEENGNGCGIPSCCRQCWEEAAELIVKDN